MIIRHATMAMGTRFEVVLAGDDEWSLRSAADAAAEEIDALHDKLSLFRSDSLVAHINRTAHERPVRLERPVFDMLQTARDVWERSAGAFDITMAAAKLGHAPAPHGMDALLLDEHALTVAFSRPGPALDLGGIAKGFALDAAAVILRDARVPAALLHAGTSSVVALGAPDDQPDGWRIALGATDAPVVALRNASLSVSAHRRADAPDTAPSHVIDPRTGAPAEAASHATLAACIANDSVLAEAWSTALLVLAERPPAMPPGCLSLLRVERDGAVSWHTEGDPNLLARFVRI